eukprot:6846563-Pyramimonas_sp.AAC.2
MTVQKKIKYRSKLQNTRSHTLHLTFACTPAAPYFGWRQPNLSQPSRWAGKKRPVLPVESQHLVQVAL